MSTFESNNINVESDGKIINHILVVIAMEDEAKPFLGTLEDLTEVPSTLTPSPFKFYSGKCKGYKVAVVLNGKSHTYGVDNVGTTPGNRCFLLCQFTHN